MNTRTLAHTTCFKNMEAFGKTRAAGLADATDALVNNLFKGNATLIGEWAAASHVERQGTRKAKPVPAPAPAPKSPGT